MGQTSSAGGPPGPGFPRRFGVNTQRYLRFTKARWKARLRSRDQGTTIGVRRGCWRLARFESEAQLLASLNSVNIAAIFGLAEQSPLGSQQTDEL